MCVNSWGFYVNANGCERLCMLANGVQMSANFHKNVNEYMLQLTNSKCYVIVNIEF